MQYFLGLHAFQQEPLSYSTDGGKTWKNGTSFTGSSQITSFLIRVNATNGQTYDFAYSNGAVSPVA